MKGGDPSAPYLFYAMKVEENVSQEMYTGTSNFRLTGKYRKYQDLSYLSSNQIPYFNGNQTISQVVNPWREEVPLAGYEVMAQPFVKSDDENNPK